MLFRCLRSSTFLFLCICISALVPGCGEGDVTPGEDSGVAIDARVDRDGSSGDVDARTSDVDGSTSDVDGGASDVDGSASDVDASMSSRDGGMQPDGCVTPRCPPIPVGCEVVAGPPCTCGTIVCPPTPCSPACGRGEYCMYEMHCGGDGACAATPDACIDLFAPVCGCDGETYGNSCEAAAAGQSVASDGECAPPPGDCRTEGCRGGATCEECRGIGGPVYACIPRGAAC